tara:strand:+ start:894 stop:1115 length:222 start_codon:yes stop_codon:yes gene_type:complete
MISDPMDLVLELECKYCDYEEVITVHEADYIAWHNGELIQDVMYYLTDSQRELIISDTCGDCFDKFFPEDKDD